MDYTVAFKEAATKLDALIADYAATGKRLTEIGIEVSQIVEVIKALGPLAGEKVGFTEATHDILRATSQAANLELSITDRIRQIMAATAPNLTFLYNATTIRTALEAGKYDLSKHSNPMATIHGVLKRLQEQQQIIAVSTNDGKGAYRWNPAVKLT